MYSVCQALFQALLENDNKQVSKYIECQMVQVLSRKLKCVISDSVEEWNLFFYI